MTTEQDLKLGPSHSIRDKSLIEIHIIPQTDNLRHMGKLHIVMGQTVRHLPQ